ncbi:hypothetical protein M2139_002482 [Enterococcus sp. PF1-24]|uniref:hypothetical protein n=1 Tax=unclassified Enterococcus TaxID=2608891 RepID=UPI002476D742|nr:MULTISPECIES: hypothetical protein [unclassified Enterococcus]MDH6365468.1 hypothetical protein [Enterococcus sp. PFB1-1]MDH6402578.1 hypothetical protein [Enterococcus sp. PF1-24]
MKESGAKADSVLQIRTLQGIIPAIQQILIEKVNTFLIEWLARFGFSGSQSLAVLVSFYFIKEIHRQTVRLEMKGM